MKIINLGILAHVDAGKTSLTERLLFNAGVIREIGRVDDGSTQTDTLALERQRGITIKSAVVSFAVGDTTINLIDTPGHSDFIAEVERSLSVLDAAVLVISAVEGVQAQTRVLMRTLQQLHIPTVLFVNKMDRMGADAQRVVQEIGQKLGAASSPVYFGSAITGEGVEALTAGIAELPGARGDATGTVSAIVFKIERVPSGEKIAYVRMFDGAIQVRDRLPEGRVTAIQVFENGASVPQRKLMPGLIGKIWGLPNTKIGDALGATRPGTGQLFAPPTLETVVKPINMADKGRLYTSLAQLAEQDPLINLRQDDVRQELSVSLYGEVQKEVIQSMLEQDFGVQAEFSETTTICIERVLGTGRAHEVNDRAANPLHPFLATIGLRVEAGAIGSGVEFRLEVSPGSMPAAFFKATEEAVRSTLLQGMYGWEVTDCIVTMTHSGYWPRQSHAHATFDKSMSSTAGDFRNLTPLILMRALKQAGTVVCEPLHRFELELPVDALSQVAPVLARLRGVPRNNGARDNLYVCDGTIPAAQVHELQQRLPGLTRGEGVLMTSFDGYSPVIGVAPKRARTDGNPLNLKEYLLRVARRS